MIHIRIVYDALKVIFPTKCPLCGTVLKATEIGACWKCMCSLPVIHGARCIRCSKQVDEGEEFCSDCKKRKFVYMQGYAMWHYNSITDRVVAGLKYKRRRDYTDFLALELSYHCARYLNNWKTDALIPVPLHSKKLRNRGFNQAQLLASGISNNIGIPVRDDIIVRCRKTRPQKYLDDKNRAVNLKGAFTINPKYFRSPDKLHNVVLVDDVYTTGSTINSCAEVLINEGISNVYFVCLCIGDGY